MRYPLIYRKQNGSWEECSISELDIGDIVQMIDPDDGAFYPTLLEVTKKAEQRKHNNELIWDFDCIPAEGKYENVESV